MNASEELLELAKDKFGKLTEAEEKLFRDTVNGEIADYSTKDEKIDDPEVADDWGDGRVLRASRIAWLCIDKQASQFATHRGIHVKGSRIDEQFDLTHANVSFPLHFERCKFRAEIYLLHARIAELYMDGTYTNQIFADGLKVDGHLNLRNGFWAKGEVGLLGATIGGNLDSEKGRFINKSGKALCADGLKVEGCVFLQNCFLAEGEVRLVGATVGGDLDCRNAKFINKDGKYGIALNGDGLNVKGSVFLRNNFRADGKISLVGAKVRGDLDCSNGQFINKNEHKNKEDDIIALNRERSNIGGSVFFSKGFRIEGKACLRGAKIGGDLDCRRGTFINRNRVGLFANGLRVQGDVFLCDELRIECKISLVSAIIGGLLHFTGLVSTDYVWLDLRYANIHTLRDEKKSWPNKGRLFLHGLLYDEIHNKAEGDANDRIDWIRRQYDIQQPHDFWTQPYEQLSKVLRKSGDEAGAKDILISKNEDKASRTQLTRSQWFWYRLLGPRIGYGHRPLQALRWVLGLILISWALFALGYSYGLITPPGDSAYTTKEKSTVTDLGDPRLGISTKYPVFNSLVYSLDVFVPVVEFHQAKYWLPNANRGIKIIKVGPWPLHTGGLLLFWLWTETVLGWVLSTLFLVGLTGLIRT
jgi:hypothetical protein